MIVGLYGENRRYAELRGVVGLLAKTVPVVSKLDGGVSFQNLVRTLEETLQMVNETQEAFSWQHLGLESQSSQQLPLQFSYEEAQQVYVGGGLSFQVQSLYACTTPFKLKLSCSESAVGVTAGLFYDSHSYRLDDVLLLAGQLRVLLASISDTPARAISELKILPPDQRSLIMKEWSGFDRPYPREKGLAELFEEQVQKTPALPALVFENCILTYAELNHRSNQLGNFLRKKGVTAEKRVGLLMERSIEMVVGILGVLKAGGAYVPLDPGYPQERLKYMVEDAGVELLLVQEHGKAISESLDTERIVLDEEAQRSAIARESGTNLTGESHPARLAYVIYTSGSTGKPKGVMIAQEAILYRLWWAIEQFPIGSADAILQKTAFTFDASVWEIFVPLMTGARLVMAKPGGQADSRYLVETIEREKITVLQLVPSMLRIFLQEPGVERCGSSLKRVFSGGEALSTEVVERFRKKLHGVKLQNLYGPTEASIDAASWSCDGELDAGQAYVPLGHPLVNARIYILDEKQELSPAGVTGEIHIGGAGLGRGYASKPDLTAERFIPNPFGDQGGTRLYRTGDLGRYRGDGVIEFLGRKDEQVKVRGYRIELGEIEAELAGYPGVREAAVAAVEDEAGGKRLVGYVVLRHAGVNSRPGEHELKEYLSGRLPDYLIPSVIMEMAELPRTPNGKLDRRALPQPDFGSTKEYVAPRTGTEEILAQLWADVLKVERVSIEENFFEAGGHSLLATQLMARVRETFGIDIALAKLFEHETVEGLAREIEQELRGGDGAAWRGPIKPRTGAEKRSLSYAQQRLWFLDQLEPGAVAYNLAAGIELQGDLNVAVLERSLNEVIRRHEALRTRFATGEDGEPEQVVLNENQVRIALHPHEVAGGTIESKRSEVIRLAEAEAATPFDLKTGPLVRMKLLRLAERHHVALFTLHHIVSDGWSQGLIVEEIGRLYAAYVQNQKPELKELPIQYGDYAAWQREWLQGEVLERQLQYWRKRLSGMSGVLELPTQHPRPALQSYKGAHYRRSLDAELSKGLHALASRENVTLYMLLLASLDVLLWRYSGQADISVGSPIANRTRKETESLIGFFVNTLVLRVEIDAEESFSQLLKRVREAALGAYAHQDVPFEKLVEELRPERDLSRSPLFQVMFALQNMPSQELELPGLKVKGLESETSISKFDLTFFVSETAGVLDGVLEYNTGLFTPEAAGRMWGHWEELLRNIVADSAKAVAALSLLRAEERHQILDEWNQTQREFPRAGSIALLFEEQVERTPDAPAVVFSGESLSYSELNRRANQFAHQLIAHGVSADCVVGLLVERNVNFLVGMLAVWKAGGAYLPLDCGHPVDRLRQIVLQSRLSCVVTDERHSKLLAEVLETLPASSRPQVATIAEGEQQKIPAANPGPRSAEKNLAYVIYTSGSTGIPKGAMVEQAGMLNHLYAKVTDLGLGPADRIAQTASQNFDISVWQFMAGLLVGSQIEIVPEETAHDPAALWHLVGARGVTILELVPSLVGSLLHEEELTAKPVSLRWLLVTGEAVSPQICRQWLQRYPRVPMLNAYGPTECSDDVTHHEVREPSSVMERVPIGRAVANLQMYVLDERREPVPFGVSGELYVGGIGVGRGYMNDPSRTAESFVPDAFGPEPGTRLYRTGDLGRYCEKGVIEYLGRLDHQVKIRGFRIELGEIEAALAKHENVQESAVLARQDEPGDRRLVAYVVFKQSHSGNIGTSELKNYLQERLPDYMVPGVFVTLDDMPRTANGKLDRKALPKPDSALLDRKEFLAPQTEPEILLAQIWADVLKLERVGIRDDFFDLGGHSLLATQLMSRVRKVFRVEGMPLRRLFENPTVQALARAIGEELQEDAPPIPRRRNSQKAPLSYMQRRVWFLDQLGPKSSVYNLSSAVKLQGFLNAAMLERSLNEVVRRHEALRTVFAVDVAGEPEQIVREELKIKLQSQQISGATSEEKWLEVKRIAEQEALEPFDLRNGPLVRARLLQLGEHEHVALFTLHHIVSDGWSQGILIDEIAQSYAAHAQESRPALRELPIQYGDYAAWQREWLQGPVLERQMSHWRKYLEGMSGVLELPADRPRPAVQSYRGAHYRIALEHDLSRRLQQLARAERATLFMVLQAAFKVLLARYSGQQDVAIGTPIANRTREEVERLIGFFVNTLVLRTVIDSGESFRHLLKRVQESTLGAYVHQDVPFEKLVEELKPERDLSRSPLFQVMFALQNMPPVNVELPGLVLHASDVESHTSKFDMTLFLADSQAGNLAGWMEYSTDLFDETTIARLVNHWTVMLQAIVDAPESAVFSLPLLNAEESSQIVYGWNQTARDYPRNLSLIGLIEEQAARTPQAVAVSFEEQTLSYAELNRRANQLGSYLKKQGVAPEQLVAVCMERSLEMVVALLAVLKAGGAYVPLDPAYPEDRLAYMVQDAGAKWILSQERLQNALPQSEGARIYVDRDWPSIASETGSNLACEVTGENLVYVIYTSGSTGKPKGAMNRDAGVRNRLQWMQEAYGLKSDDRVLQKTPFSFDVSVWEFFWPLMTGAQLVVARPGGHQDSSYLVKLIQDQSITTVHFVPSMLQVFVEEPGVERCTTLRRVICSGEALGRDLQERFQQRLPWAELHNLYGPTEAAVDVTAWTCKPDADVRNVPLGWPIANIQIHVLDEHLQPVPSGVAGEIHIGGEGLGRGYWNRPGLTAERFIANPFSKQPGQRLYKTGDLGRYRRDGVIEYLGRLDHQIKLRGFRIELGEIETVLASYPAVREAAVLVHDSRLVGYVVKEAGNDTKLLSNELKDQLRLKLPEYMVPSAILEVERMPLSPNGKLDRKALPKPEMEAGVAFVAPRTVREQILARIWADVLHVEVVGIDDNYFNLGGDSIRSIQVRARAEEAGLHFSLQDLFHFQTIRKLVEGTATTQREDIPEISAFSLIAEDDRKKLPADIEDAYPLATVQRGMLFHQAYATEDPVYHNVNSYQLRMAWDHARFQDAVQAAVARHPILRTSFDLESYKEPLQLVHREGNLIVGVTDLRGLTETQQEKAVAGFIEEEKHKYFDLARAPHLRLHVHRRSEDRIQFSVTENHVILDGWSLHATLTEIFTNYFALMKGRTLAAEPPLRTTYRQYIAVELQAAQSKANEHFWAEALSDFVICELPQAEQIETPVRRIDLYDVEIPDALSASLKNLAKSSGVPLKSVLLAAHLKVMSVITGNRDQLTGMIFHGRLATADGDQVRGLFLNVVPFRQQLESGSWRDLIQSVLKTEEGLLPYSRYPFPLIQRGAEGQQLFDAVFNFVHFHVADGLLQSGEVEILDFKKYEATNYKLVASFSLNAVTSQVTLELEYDVSQVSVQQAKTWAEYYGAALRAMAEDPSVRHDNVSLLSETERRLAVHDWNPGAAPDASAELAHHLFERQAASMPNATAVVFEDQQLTYAELNRKANQLARYLVRNGLSPDQVVGLCMERTHQAIVSVLAVLKAGGSYVWLDPNFPQERLAYILQDARIRLVVSETKVCDALPSLGAKVVLLDKDALALDKESEENPDVEVHPANLAYLIYTSGSTGKPKGVGVIHKNLSSFIAAQHSKLRLAQGTTTLQFFSFSFDASVWEWIMLLSGAKVVVVQSAQLSGDDLKEVMERLEIQVALITPTILRTVPPGGLPKLHTLCVGAEFVGPDVVETWASGRRVFNCYGPTETTVAATMTDPLGAEGVPPIGKPLANAQVFVADNAMMLSPVGARGELYIGGAGVSRGYWNDPALTAERFVPDPFSGQAGARLYRTGDIVKWRYDGNLNFIERADQQVKIRGFRIELGEIESALISCPGIREAVVIAVEDQPGDKRLVAYVVMDEAAEGRQKLDSSAAREHLRGRLPEYMVPAAIVELEKMPLTSHGKLDRKLLPRPEADRAEEYVHPQTDTEKRLAQIWSEVLKVERVGLHDNFFELGGHSLLALQMISRVRETFQAEISVRVFFVESATLSALAARIDQIKSTQQAPAASRIEARPRKTLDLEAALAKIGELSDEEVRKLLSQAKAASE
jgi:amino acid adenylation domain-containing protein